MLMRLFKAVTILALTATVARAQQLDEHCVVSILNRTARVTAFGAWVIPNVPANLGRVRARATCTVDGQTFVGQSDYFSVPANGLIDAVPITFAAPIPVPAKLILTAPNLTLAAIGETLQLSSTLRMPDGTNVDATTLAGGTNYTTSNPAVLTVSPDGLATSIGNGVAIVSALNEGALGLLRITVGSSADSDNDGIPNDWELANGLNPGDPADAALDADNDRLTNLQEFQAGTDPRNADTDGDGVGDGLEVQSGSDPLDPNSYNLAGALRRIDATPATVALQPNPLFGEATQRVTVVGTLLDGKTIDLSAASRGTTYVSSDETVCGFVDLDGLILAGNTGTCTITVGNSGFVVNVSVTVIAFTPSPVSVIAIPGYANNAKVSDGFAYVAAGSAGLQVVDVHIPIAPVIRGALALPGNAIDVRVRNGYAYIAGGIAGVHVADVHTPAAPILAGSVDTPGDAQDISIDGDYAYVADGGAGLQVVNIANPSSPVVVGSLALAGVAKGVSVSGNRAVVVTSEAVAIVDVSSPAAPLLLKQVALDSAKDVEVRGTIAYVAAYTSGFVIVDFTNATSPSITGTVNFFVPRDLALTGAFAVFAEQLFPNAIPFVDISDRTNPAFRNIIDLSSLGDYASTGIDLDERYVYMTAETYYVGDDYGVSGSTALMIAQYNGITDTAGIAPTVRVAAPTAGQTFISGSSLSVVLDASDDVVVAYGTVLLDGVQSGIVRPGIAARVVVPDGVSSLTIGATATDFGGNVGNAAEVVVNVVPDPLMTIDGFVRFEDGAPAAGAMVFVVDRTTTADAAGHYSITGLPSIVSQYIVQASISVGEDSMSGQSAPVIPVPGGSVQTDITVHNFVPTVRITTPATGSDVVVEDQISIDVTAVAANPIESITLYVDDEPWSEETWPLSGATFTITAPSSPGPIKLTAIANSAPYSGASNTVIINVIADPLTEVRGTVRDEQDALIPNATVTVADATTTTDSNGQYTVTGMATNRGPIVAKAVLHSGLEPLAGTSTAQAPVRGGTTVADVVVRPFESGTVGSIDLPDAHAVALRGTVAIVAAGASGLQFVDFSDPLSPRLIGTFALPGFAKDVKVSGSRAIVSAWDTGISTGDGGIHIVDVSDPEQAVLLGTIPPPAMGGVDVQGNTVLIAARDYGLLTFDISDPSAPVPLGTLLLEGYGRVVAHSGTIAVVGDEWPNETYGDARHGVDIVDISNPAHLVLLGRARMAGAPSSIVIRGSRAYVATSQFDGIQVIDFSIPTAPIVVAESQDAYEYIALAAREDLLVAAGRNYSTGRIAQILDIGGAVPTVIPDISFLGRYEGRSVAIYRDYAIVAAGNMNTGSSSLVTLRFPTRVDHGGVAPAVAIVSPATGDHVIHGSTMIVHVQASDDDGVESVTLSLDGHPVDTRTTAPYEFMVVVPANASAMRLSATATDFGENIGQSADVILSAIPDPLTRIFGTVRNAGGAPVADVLILSGALSTRTDAAGTYELTDAPTLGDIVIRAIARVNDTGYSATSAAISPVRGGTTSIPDLVLAPFPNGSLGSVEPSFVPSSIAARADLAVIVGNGLETIDLSNPTAPRVMGSEHSFSYGSVVKIAGDFAYVGTYYQMVVCDISNPAQPQATGFAGVDGQVRDLVIIGSDAWILDDNEIARIDISDPASPQFMGSFPSLGTFDALALDGDRLVAASAAQISVISIADPAAPVLLGSAPVVGVSYFGALAAGNHLAFIGSDAGMRTYDLSDPAAPVLTSEYDVTNPILSNLTLSGNLVLLSGINADEPTGVTVVDVSTPSLPMLVQTIDFNPPQRYNTIDISVASELVLAVGVDQFGSHPRLFVGKFTRLPAVAESSVASPPTVAQGGRGSTTRKTARASIPTKQSTEAGTARKR